MACKKSQFASSTSQFLIDKEFNDKAISDNKSKTLKLYVFTAYWFASTGFSADFLVNPA